jgi:hypothetical protein
MTSEELNTALRMEIIHYRETNVLTLDLKRLLMELVWLEMTKERYKFISDNIKILCETDAYVAACKHCIRYNPEKTDNAQAYVRQIIGSAFAGTIVKYASKLGLKKTTTRIKI